tara:strand:+ start:105 stop:233 length:129 start_codon:yes stop_codon:yes gene_type:complete
MNEEFKLSVCASIVITIIISALIIFIGKYFEGYFDKIKKEKK